MADYPEMMRKYLLRLEESTFSLVDRHIIAATPTLRKMERDGLVEIACINECEQPCECPPDDKAWQLT